MVYIYNSKQYNGDVSHESRRDIGDNPEQVSFHIKKL